LTGEEEDIQLSTDGFAVEIEVGGGEIGTTEGK